MVISLGFSRHLFRISKLTFDKLYFSIHCHILVPLTSLVDVLLNILTLQLPHPLDLVQVYDETFVVRMVLLDALAAEDCFVVRAIEMLYTLRVLLTELVDHTSFILIIKIEITVGQLLVLLDHLVQNVDI